MFLTDFWKKNLKVKWSYLVVGIEALVLGPDLRLRISSSDVASGTFILWPILPTNDSFSTMGALRLLIMLWVKDKSLVRILDWRVNSL